MTDRYFIEVVTKAAAWMDERYPGWERKIDLSKLNIHSCYDCILGQALAEFAIGTYSGYNFGMEVLEDDEAYSDFIGAFCMSQAEPLWAELIKERFNTGNFSDEV